MGDKVFLDLYLDRVRARPSGLQTIESSGKAEEEANDRVEVEVASTEQAECLSSAETAMPCTSLRVLPSDISPDLKVPGCEKELLTGMKSDVVRDHSEDMDNINVESTSDVANFMSRSAVESSPLVYGSQIVKDLRNMNLVRSNPCSSVLEETSCCMKDEQGDIDMAESGPSPGSPIVVPCFDQNSSVSTEYQKETHSEQADEVNFKSNYGNGYSSAQESGIPVEEGRTKFSGISSLPSETSSAKMHQLNRGSPLYSS